MFFHGRLYCLLLLLPWSPASANVPNLAYKRFMNETSSITSSSTTTSQVPTTLSTSRFSSSSSSLANKKLPTSHVTTTATSTLLASISSSLTTKGSSKSKHATSLTTSITSTTRLNVGAYCRKEATMSTITATPCRVSMGTVQLHYWPTGPAYDHLKFPSTTVLSKYNYTMTSPSVYYVINTMSAYELCHPTNLVGPIVKNFITGFDLSEVTTLQPFGVTSGIIDKTRIGNPRQLKLSDLSPDCPTYTAGDKEKNTVGAPTCNPVLTWKPVLKSARPEWKHCGRRHGGFFGIFDPPAPVQACLSNDCGNEGAEILTPIQTPTPTPTPNALADQQSTTMASPLPKSTSSLGASTAGTPTTTQANGLSSSPSSAPGVQEGVKSPAVDVAPTPGKEHSPTTSSKAIAIGTPNPNSPLPTPDQEDIDSPDSPPAAKPTPLPQTIATVAGQIISVSAVDSSVVVIGGQTISVGGPVATVTGHQVLSLASDGVVVQVPGGDQTTIAIPQITSAEKVATVGGQVLHISAIQSSVVVIGTQTITLGGSVATLAGDQIVSLGSSGIVVQIPGAEPTTIAIPPVISAEKVATVAGQVLHISAIQSSVVVIGTQTITIGGSVATITGNQVVSLGSSGIVVQVPGGGVTTIALAVPQLVDPTPTLSSTYAPTAGKVVSSTGRSNAVNSGTATRTLITPVNTGIGQIISDMVNTSGQNRGNSGSRILPWLGTVGLGLLCLF